VLVLTGELRGYFGFDGWRHLSGGVVGQSDPLPRLRHRNTRLSLCWLVLLFAGLVLLFLLPLAWILTLVTLLAPLMAGLIALLLLAPVRLVSLVPKILLLLVSLFLLGRVHL
jgi:hypothetical protein